MSAETNGARDDVIANAANYVVSLWPKEQIELRQGARVIHASKKE
jgi:hypothetical protein